MKDIKETDAIYLLVKDLIPNDLDKEENRWIIRSIYIGIAAKRIIDSLGLNGNFALEIGYLHDIGKKIDKENSLIAGYNYLKELGYDNIAKYSITHAFYYNNIDYNPYHELNPNNYDFINDFLNNNHVDLFSNVLHLCGLFCTDKGFTTVEKGLLEIAKRKGVDQKYLEYYNSINDFKHWIELDTKKDFYDLFKEIKEEDLLDSHFIYQEIMNLYRRDFLKNKTKKLQNN